MTDATRAQQTAADCKKVQDEFNNGSISQKADIKMIMGLSLIMASDLDRSVKTDALLSAVQMFAALIRVDTLSTILDCEKDTGAPLMMIVGTMGMKAAESAGKHERRFGTMMQLFIEEAEKRHG